LVPPLPAPELRALREDIRDHGIQEPLAITAGGVVLDGHQRLQLADELELETVPVRIAKPRDQVEYILRAALLRRQLAPAQRAAIVAELAGFEHQRQRAAARKRANLRRGPDVAKLPLRAGRTCEWVAEQAGVSPRTATNVITVRDHDPELFAAVKAGTLGADVAARRVRRKQRDAALSPPPPLPEGPFDLIYGDPPWQMGNPDGPWAPEAHYPTLALEEIKTLAVPAAENAFLALWAVTSLLPQAFEVIAAWGFEFKSALIWEKPSIKLGIWARNKHETLLLARKGSFPPPEPEDRPDSVIKAKGGRHSQKPTVFYELLETMYPHAAKLELFARNTRPGWAAWGNEVTP
jgi:N6-adenosine-specific RNA methylase IME4